MGQLVLILVLMEDTLWAPDIPENPAPQAVLILVLMEDTLWAKKTAKYFNLSELS